MQDFVRRDSGWRAGLACSHRQAALAVVAAEWYADDPQTPESLALWREAARKTYAALQGLSAKHQQVLAMTADDAPLHQIAEACGMASPQLACKHRQAAIKRLREAVGEAA
jgi:DNA-directed RNA polymerase specialized sigma24 family protein